jgi:hypothetical protein
MIAGLVTGCATLFDSKQIIRVSSKPPGAEVVYKGEKVGVTPMLLEVKTEHHPEISVRDASETQTMILKTGYRWGRSFAGNLIFLTVAPAGWITDLISGHAWGVDRNVDVEFAKAYAEKKNIRMSKSEGQEVLAIAPPQSVHANLSDEVAHKIENKLRELYPTYKVIYYNNSLKDFRNYGIDFDSSASPSTQNGVFYDLKATKIYFSEVTLTDDEVMVKGEVVDALDPLKNQKKVFDFSRTEFTTLGEVAWLSDTHSLFYWLPNTIGVDLGSTATEIGVNGTSVRATSQPFAGFWGGVETAVSTISIRRIAPPIDRDNWSFRFAFVPTLSLSYVNEQFSNVLGLQDQVFHRLHAEAGWGPSIAYGSRRWSIYLNLLPVWAYDQISTSVGNTNYSVDNSHGTLGGELGLMFFFSPRWLARAYYRSTPVPVVTWSRILSDALQSDANIQSVNEVDMGISFAYIIPSADLHFKK